ncbi:MAG: hypothetical protein J7K88_03370 [Candidatus Fermentibacteraceae bacterium]|nr:hypothetical protein [Candidatus Fermentibacteraceae bacterium]
MKLSTVVRNLFPAIILLSVVSLALAVAPPANTIPIISMKTGQGTSSFDITMDVLCMLLWHNFDGIWVEGWLTLHQEEPAILCDSAQAIMILAPSNLLELTNNTGLRWARYTPYGIQTGSAFMHPDAEFHSIDSTVYSTSMLSNIESRCSALHDQSVEYDCIWYYDIFNEAAAWQLAYMLNDSSAYDDYFPSVFSQDTNMTEVLPAGIFSWVKWKSDTLYAAGGPTVSCCFSMLHTIEPYEWAGYPGGTPLGNPHTQANSVRAYFETHYLDYPSGFPYNEYDNFPEHLDLNTYPVRLAGYYWQTEVADSITVLGSATDLWMLEHYEELMDSTFIPAGIDEDGPFPIHYHPQAFGRTGGEAIFVYDSVSADTILQYGPYHYRIPSPAEFRMLCNIGLLRGAKGVFPYSIRSYSGWKDDTLLHHDTGLLDEDLIPFDAPYEDWVYRERPVGDYYYAPPDSIPPWTAADDSQFDPLYSLPSRPVNVPGSQRNIENYQLWKFDAYGRLWNSVRGTFRQIAWVAPELSRLWWWFTDRNYSRATIEYDGAILPQYFAEPHIRVFTDSTESTCYLFYVNRFCREDGNPFEIEVDADDFSGAPFSEYALDHSRRFIIEGSETSGVFTFLDTLDAGEARLLQMFDDDTGLPADLRITDPDIFVVIPADGDTLTVNTSVAGTPFDPYAWVYNMGTEPLSNIKVYLEDITTDTTLIDSVYLSFSGLSTGSCYQTDRELASFRTITPDTSDIGVNIFRVYTERIQDEPDPSDNSATLVYMVRPGDYATEILDDPWDMTEATSSIPAWYTNDIDTLTGCWGGYTDSISGMFEGVLSNPTTANALYLNTGTGSSDYIDADRFHNLSLAGMSETKTVITVHWLDSHENTGYIALTNPADTLRSVAADLGPWDLTSLSGSWTGDMQMFWLQFTSPNSMSPADVRIGWVKLTE